MLVACKPSAPSYLPVPPCTRAVRWASYPAIRTGSSNTLFFFIIHYSLLFTPPSGRGLVIPIFKKFFHGHLCQTSGFCSAKQILVTSFAIQVRARTLSGRNIFCILGEGQQRLGLIPGAFLVFFFGGHLPQTSGFRSAKQILVVSSATMVRAPTLSDRNIFCTLGEGQQWQGLMPLGLFLFSFFIPTTKLQDTGLYP